MSQAKRWQGSRPQGLARLSPHRYQQASWTRDDLVFEQHLPSRSCTCEAGTKGRWCKHLTSAFVAALVDQLGQARVMEGRIRRKLLKEGTHRERPDIEMALLVAEWEEQRAADLLDEPPSPEGPPPPEGGELSEEEAAELDTQLTRTGKTWDDLPRPRRRYAPRPDAARWVEPTLSAWERNR